MIIINNYMTHVVFLPHSPFFVHFLLLLDLVDFLIPKSNLVEHTTVFEKSVYTVFQNPVEYGFCQKHYGF